MGSSTQTLIFPLTNRSVRQVFDYETDTVAYRLMYDSGARIPVWCSDVEFFLLRAIFVWNPDGLTVAALEYFCRHHGRSLLFCIYI